MRAAALLMWLVAIALLMLVLLVDAPGGAPAGAFVQVERSLLAIAPATPAPVPQPLSVVPQVSPPAAVATPAIVAGCSRLGVFPRRNWAEHVASILSAAAEPASAVKVERVTSSIEEAPPRSWRVQRIGPDAYYLQFDAWGIDELASRMTLQRALLKRLLSINAIPEAC